MWSMILGQTHPLPWNFSLFEALGTRDCLHKKRKKIGEQNILKEKFTGRGRVRPHGILEIALRTVPLSCGSMVLRILSSMCLMVVPLFYSC